jgi:hypothetical protein
LIPWLAGSVSFMVDVNVLKQLMVYGTELMAFLVCVIGWVGG